MTIVIFVRHGESKANAERILSEDIDSYPLTERGAKQADSIGMELSKIKGIYAIYSSPIRRARQTAEAISRHVGTKEKDIKLDDRLLEMGLGNLNGMKKPDEFGWKYEPEKYGLENFDSIKRRMKSFIDGLPNELVIVVTHREPISAVIALMFDMDHKSAGASGPEPGRIAILDLEKNKIMALNTSMVSDELASKLSR